jgi:predicted lipoprotein with Yx(FWY)xxD motif
MQSKILVTSAIAAALLGARCGGTTPSTATARPSPSPAASPTPSPVTTKATIAVAKNAKLGKILVDGSGRTIYLFTADTSNISTCNSFCTPYWPPVLTAGAPQARGGVTASILGTTMRPEGTTQVTYGGHPLYYFWSDSLGETNGQGINVFGGLWWVMSPSGAAIH